MPSRVQIQQDSEMAVAYDGLFRTRPFHRNASRGEALSWGQRRGAILKLEEFVRSFGEPYSKALGIDLQSKRKEEIVKWFLASILYSKPIRETTATLTYRTFEAYETLSIDSILSAGWDGLVQILDEGGYVRYDFSTATKLLEVFGNLRKRYNSDLWNLYNDANDSSDLERHLKALGKGVGDTTVSVFLRDMRAIWPKSNPKLTPLEELALEELGIKDLEALAKRRGLDIVRLQTALLRLGKDFLKRGKEVDVTLG